eukprot:2304723-Pyramimonas_sp.AAC.1
MAVEVIIADAHGDRSAVPKWRCRVVITEALPANLTHGHIALSTKLPDKWLGDEIVRVVIGLCSAADVFRAPKKLPFVPEILHADGPARHVALPIVHMLLQRTIFDELFVFPGVRITFGISKISSVVSPLPQLVAAIVQQ